MGNNTSSSGAGGKRGSQALDAARSASIDAELKKAKIALKNEVKLLLLGSGESGKSTILKQVRLAYKEGFTQAERQRYTELILDNIFYNTRDLLDGYSVLGIPIPTSCVLSADLINDSGIEPFEDDGKMKLEVVEAVRRIWDESETKEVVKRANEFQLSDSAAYFFDDLDRIAAQDYLPSDDDILRTRIRTTGVVEESVRLKNGVLLRCLDVGGQRSERKKWIHCFENVTVLLFVVALSEYDQVLFEDHSVNRMTESLLVFETISSSRWFLRSSFVIFLNKIDLFRLKLLSSPLSHHFPEYHGGASFPEAAKFVRNLYLEVDSRQNLRGREPHIHLTCGVDGGQIRKVLGEVMDTLLRNTLMETGLIVGAAPIITAGAGLTAATWNTVDEGMWFVEHYSPYCGHCKSFAPKWRDLVDSLTPTAKSHNFHFAQVDCAANGDLCNSNGVKYYPSLFLYDKGEKVATFEGKRDVKTLTAWIEERWYPEEVKEKQRLSKEGDGGLVIVDEEEEGEKKAAKGTFTDVLLSDDEEMTTTLALTPESPATASSTVTQVKPERFGPADGLVMQGRSVSGGKEPDGEVHTINEEGVLALRKGLDGVAFVKYYAPWCGHCKKLAPVWTELAAHFKGAGGVNFYEIDCDTAMTKYICRKENVKAFPTLVFYNEGARVEYKGKRDLASLKEFAAKAASHASARSIANEYELKRATSTEDVVFLFLHPGDASKDDLALAKSASNTLLGGPAFYTSSSPDLFSLFSLSPVPTLLVFKDHSLVPSSTFALPLASATPSLSNKSRLTKTTDWIRTAKLPTVSELGGANYNDIMAETGDPPYVALAILSPHYLGAKFEQTKKEWEAVARGWSKRVKKVGGKDVIWAWVDGDKWAGWAKGLYGIKGATDQAVIVADPKKFTYWKSTIEGKPLVVSEAVYNLVEDGIYTGAVTPLSSKNFVDRVGDRIASIFTGLGSGISSHPLLFFLFLGGGLAAAWFGARAGTAAAAGAAGKVGGSSYAKLE